MGNELGQRARLRRLGAGVLAMTLSFGAVTVAPPPVWAQSPSELAKARTQFKEGVSLEAAGDWAGALAKFEEVAKVKTTPAVRFHIARCKEHLGRLNEALGEYRMAEYEAQQTKAKELDEITKAKEQLEARVPKLSITRGKGAESAKVELDGVALGEAQIGKDVSTDPGPHRIVAKIGGSQFEQTVTLAEGENKAVELVPPEDFKAAPAGAQDEPKPEPGVQPEPSDGVKVEKKGKGALPWLIGGVGVVGLGAAGYFYLKRNQAEDDLNKVCRPDGTCPASKQSLSDDGKRYALLTNVGVAVGVVGIGVATVMLLSGGGKSEPPKTGRLKLQVAPTPDWKGVNVVGAF